MPGDGGGGATGGAAAKEPWETPQGRACIARWEAEVTRIINAHDGGRRFNRRKPWSFNKYGIVEGAGVKSAFAPDAFKDHNNDRYWYMWDVYVPGPGGWDWPEWNDAKVPPLREYVTACMAKAGG
jgi:hypothetical protein